MTSMYLAAACAPSRVEPTPEADIASAVGIEGAVTFRVQGDPLQPQGLESVDLSLEAAVRRVLESDPGIQRALCRVRAALADSDQARLLPNPILSVLFRFPSSGGKVEIEAGLSVSLASILQRGRLASAADRRLRAASSEAVKTALDTVLLVKDTYARSQVADAQVPLLEARRETLDRLLAFARARLEGGEGTQLDVDGIATQRVLVDLELEQKTLERREVRIVLARLIGQPLGDAGWRLESWKPEPPADAAEQRWIEKALGRRPEIQVVTWELGALGDDLALAGFASVLSPSAGIAAERDDGGWSIGPSASAAVPFLDWGQARRDRARAEIVEKRHELAEVQRRVVQEVRVALESYRYARHALARVQEELLPLQERRRARIEQSFRADEVDLTALLLAEQEAKAVQANRVALEYLVSVSLARLERAVGGGGVAKSL